MTNIDVEKENHEKLISIIRNDVQLMNLLRVVRKLNLPDWFIAGGAIRNTVWDYLHNFKEKTPFNDVDVTYFDKSDIRTEKDTELENFMSKKRPDIKWNFFNQARKHLKDTWIGGPVKNTSEGISYWCETPTCTGARLEKDDSIIITAPHGLRDLFNLTVRPIAKPFRRMELYHERIKNKEWQQKWPLLKIYDH